MYSFSVSIPGSVPEQVERVTALLQREGFGVLTRIDAHEVLREKLGVERAPYVILGACRPALAKEALDREPDVGLLLPCNVVVREDPGGEVTVAFMDPKVVLKLAEASLEEVATEARERLERVCNALRGEHGRAAPETGLQPPVVRRRLHLRRDELAERIQRELGDEGDLVAERDPEWEDLSARHGLADLLDRFGARDLRELARIDAALGRVEAGTYGRCTSCGDRIATDRLLALPEAELCADCQEQAEVSAPL